MVLKKFAITILLLCSLLTQFLQAEETPTQTQPTTQTEKNDINYLDAAVLGFVEGVTEFLPVSSTGHLILANAFLHLDSESPLTNDSGKIVRDKKNRPYTLKMAADAYAIIIQIGAILAVAMLYRLDILAMLAGLLGKSKEGLKLTINLIVAFMPAAVIGLLIHDFIEEKLFGVLPVIIALAAGGVLMFIAQKIYDKRATDEHRKYPRMEEMTVRQALLVGMLQCVAMCPGTSRSMMTILGGYAAGLKPADAARFSFLLGLITLSAASAFKMLKDGEAILQTISIPPLALGLIVAFFSALLSVKWLVGFLTRRGLTPFAWYRIAIALLLSGLVFAGLL